MNIFKSILQHTASLLSIVVQYGKKTGTLFLVFALVVSWVFSGWPQMFDFPPKIEQAQAADVAFDAATNSGDLSGLTSGSWSHTTSGSNRYLVVGLAGWDETNSLTNVTVTYNGVSMTKLGGQETATKNNAVLWGLALEGVVATGAFTVAVSNIPASYAELAGGSVSFTGVDQTSSTGTLASVLDDDGGATGNSVNITLASGDLGVDILYAGTCGANEPTTGANGTMRVNRSSSGGVKWHMMGTEGGTGTVAMDWTCTGQADDWAHAAIPLKAVSSTIEQQGFRFRNDDGSESSATWLAAQNTDITQPSMTNTRLRLQATTTGDVASTQYQLEYKLSTDNWWTKATTTTNEYAAPYFVAKGTFTSGTGALAVPDPAGIQAGDVLLMCVSTDNGDVTTPTGWTEETVSSPQGTGTAGAVTAVRSEVFYRVATSTTANTFAVADTTGYSTAITTAFRGVSTTTPIDISAGSVETASTTAMSFPAVTTTVPNALIYQCAGLNDDEADTTNASGEANAALTTLTEQHDQTVISGTGGGLVVYTGVKATVGTTGNTTATGDLSGRHSYQTIALKPIIQKILIAPSSNITDTGEDTTAQLSVPGGKLFTAGRINDTENPGDAVDIASDRYSEFEWNIIATTTVANDDIYQFRMTKAGTAFDTYTVTPQWTIGSTNPTYTQNSYRWYINRNSVQPGNPKKALNTAITSVDTGNLNRLRMDIAVATANLSASGQAFILQYKTLGGGCDAAESWTSVGNATSSALWRGFVNSGATDGAAITSALLDSSNILGSYNDIISPTFTNPNAIDSGQSGEWDWTVYNNGAAADTAYCFRVAKTGGTALDTYTNYAQLTTATVSSGSAGGSGSDVIVPVETPSTGGTGSGGGGESESPTPPVETPSTGGSGGGGGEEGAFVPRLMRHLGSVMVGFWLLLETLVTGQ
ncbi:hypothetical protein A3H16_02230 [Candidatus Kaiserbacteria bacterium RIFCSPLOWO2_12_FULL_53_8]|uniref:Uncharacterized protein n=1 Tax=Candidatus Kaiserbacteria bacterium RIFCSPLOWO2_12_FULL_53_8 TaxID=1798529 RepID=A0A1F6FYS1_9BACT|nr:MAG: hypothetical protein A3H16_02230 [Candidatus Kaiserbacteria bacterium RIFCSPLOWO2_12_FULL_53_8]